jgi:Tol biopolymer transport system component
MGEVYAAEDVRLRRTVALKVLPDAIASEPDRVRRFTREARAAAALNHPGIVTIFSVEEANGRPFITMELVEGQPLGDVIPLGGLAVERVVRLGAAIAEAVNAAHTRSIVHRDLKPANVMVTSEESVKVLDFGLAWFQRPQSSAGDTTRMDTTTGGEGLVGTVAYMSPEQAEGKPLDHRSDIFSLGVMLYEMITGHRPFQGDSSLSILSAILKDAPQRLSEAKPRTPLELEGIVHRCLEKNPVLRYQSAADLARDLVKAGGEPLTLPPAFPSVSSIPVDRRSSTRYLGIALVGLAIAASAGGGWSWMTGRLGGGTVRTAQVSRITNDGTAAVAAISPDGRHLVHIRNINGHPSLWVRQVTTESELQIVAPADVKFLGAAYSADGNDILFVTLPRGGEWGSLFKVSALGGQPQRVAHDVDSGVAVSPDGERLAFVRYQITGQGVTSRLVSVRADGTDERVVATRPDKQRFTTVSPSWSPDGSRILSAVRARDTKEAVAIVDVASGRVQDVPGEWTGIAGMDWLNDGRTFLVSATAVLGQPTQLWQIASADGTRSRVTTDLDFYGAVSVSNDGKTAAAVLIEAVANVFVAPAPVGSEVTRLTTGQAPDGVAGLTWTSDGRVVFTSLRGGKAGLFSVAFDQSAAKRVSLDLEAAGGPSISRDGKYLLFQGLDASGWRIWLSGVDGDSARPISSGPNDLNPIASPDEQWIYYTTSVGGLPTAIRTPFGGGAFSRIGREFFSPSDVLPDGRLLGIAVLQDAAGVFTQVLALASQEGVIERRFSDVPLVQGPVVAFSLGPRVTPDGTEVSFVDIRDGSANIWTKPIAGGAAKRLTSFEDDEIFSFAWSPRGDLAVAKGHLASDVIALTIGENSGGRLWLPPPRAGDR